MNNLNIQFVTFRKSLLKVIFSVTVGLRMIQHIPYHNNSKYAMRDNYLPKFFHETDTVEIKNRYQKRILAYSR